MTAPRMGEIEEDLRVLHQGYDHSAPHNPELRRVLAWASSALVELEEARRENEGIDADVLLEIVNLKAENAQLRREYEDRVEKDTRYLRAAKAELSTLRAAAQKVLSLEEKEWGDRGFDELRRALSSPQKDAPERCTECECGVELVTEGEWAGHHFDGEGYRECSAHSGDAPEPKGSGE